MYASISLCIVFNYCLDSDKVHGFNLFQSHPAHYRDVQERLSDWKEVYTANSEAEYKRQTARCMDCGVPFCQGDTGRLLFKPKLL